MPKRIRKGDDLISYGDAHSVLADELFSVDETINVGTFDDFVQGTFALSYPQYSFNTWHIRKVSKFIDDILASERKRGVVVLPRYHLKSTLCGYALSIYRMLTSFGDGLYTSFKDELAGYHLSNLKQSISVNPKLNPLLIDQRPQSEAGIHYRFGNKRLRIFSSGIFGMKRGIHTSLVCLADDILGTVQNPMTLTEIEKAARTFNEELANIPNKGCPLIVFGTVIDYSDLFFQLKDNPQFDCLWLPAEHPDPEHDVLWSAVYDKEWLGRQKQVIGWKAFSTEFLLTPVLATEAFFVMEELVKVINKQLKNTSIYEEFDKEDQIVVAGLDVGKRRHPSHLSVFVSKGDEPDTLKQIHQSFWDQMEYTDQIEKIQTAIENFGIDRLYYDNTRGELEERGLPKQCVPITFSGRGQRSTSAFATDFAKRVENGTIEILDDDRFVSQILCVTNDLKAPNSPMGHGDSFWSTALAIGAYDENYAKHRRRGFANLGNMQEIVSIHEASLARPDTKLNSRIDKFKDQEVCKVCGHRFFEIVDTGWKCLRCATVWERR